MYTSYFFDFDYTLANSERGIIDCVRHTLKKLDYKDVSDDLIRRTIGMPLKEAAVIATGESDKEKVELFFSTFLEFSDTYMTVGTEFYPDTLDVLRELKRRGKNIAKVSSKRSQRIAEKFALEKASDLVDLIIGNNEVENLKPAPDGLLIAMKEFGIDKSDVLYTGDSIIDAEAAKRGSIDFAAVTTGVTPSEAFAPYPHVKIMRNLSELLTL